MNTTQHRPNRLPDLALAFALWWGLIGATTSAQTVIEVAGDGVIGDEILTTDAGVATVPANGSNWTTPGGAGGGGNTAESFLISPDVSVPTTGTVTLRVSHRYFFEEDANGAWDGGAIFVSINGAEATYVPSSSFSAGSYDNTVGTNPGTAWQGGEEIFTGKSTDYDSTVSNLVDSVVDLGSLTMGDTVSVEFRAIWDEGTVEPDTNWEVATVTLEDSVATPFLDVDFTADGNGGFTVESNATVNGAAWTYALPVNTFEADVDTTTADRYAPDIAGTTTVIDLNGAAIAIEILTGTLDVGDTITIFDLSGGTTLTGSFSSVSLPGGQWDISNLETDGTITCLDAAIPLIYEPFNDLDPNLDDNTPGLGLPGVWESSPNSSVAAESLKYGALATQGGRMTSNLGGSNFQKSEVSAQTLIDEGLLDDGATVWFSVLMVKHPVGPNSNRRTYFSLGTGPPDGFDRIRTGPDSADNGSGFTVVVNKVGDTGVTAQAWNDGSDGAGGATRGATDLSVADGDTFLAVGKITWGQFNTTADTFDLYLPSKDLTLGPVVSTISADFDQLGTADPANTFAWIGIGGGRKDNNAPQLDEIRFAATSADVLPLDLSAPVIVATDPVDDSPNGSGSQQIATFDKEVLVGSGDIRIVNDTNPGTTTISIDDTTQVLVSGNTLTITPALTLIGGDSYHIEIDEGAVTNLALADFGGISDPDVWNFTVDGTPPSVASFGDNTSPKPILINSTGRLVYTVTFSEPMDAGTVSTADFAETAGSASATVDSVTATGDPAVFEVAVSTLGTAGTLTLEIVAGAVITDVGGNPLDTTTAIPSDNTIDVNNPTPNAGSLTNDFQGTIASQGNPNASPDGEGRWFHVSVNEDAGNSGTGWYCANDTSGTPAPAGVRNFTGPVVAYKFLGNSGDGNVTSTAGSGGEDTRITYTTEDAGYDGFGQQQLRLWEDNDPGADLATGAAGAATGFNNNGNYGYRDWQGATGIVDISGLESGSVHIYYGAYSSTPTLKVTMRDTDNVGADIVINDAHSIAGGGNGDAANNGEYYVAEIDFVTDGVYDVILYEWFSSNGRGLGTVLTGPDVIVLDDYSTWAALYPAADLADPDGDYDGDGLDNDYERIFGLDPTAANSLDPFVVPLDVDGTVATFAFSRRDDALTGLFTDIETSFDLEMWTEDTGALQAVGTVDGSTMIEIVGVTLSPGLLSAPKLFVRINQNDGTLLSENFELDDGGFTAVTSAGSAWEDGAPTSGGAGGTVTGGNGGSTNAWGTDIGSPGYYADSTITCLRSPVIDLAGVAAAELLFAEALDLEQNTVAPDDIAVVNIIDDTTDTVIAAAIYTAVDSDDSNSDWANVGPIAIPAAALGQKVRIEWCLNGFGGDTDDYLGWYIDDVTVRETMP